MLSVKKKKSVKVGARPVSLYPQVADPASLLTQTTISPFVFFRRFEKRPICPLACGKQALFSRDVGARGHAVGGASALSSMICHSRERQ